MGMVCLTTIRQSIECQRAKSTQKTAACNVEVVCVCVEWCGVCVCGVCSVCVCEWVYSPLFRWRAHPTLTSPY